MAGGRTRRWWRAAALLGAVTILAACNPDAGTKAKGELAQEMRAQIGDHFVDVTGRATNDMPGAGHLDGEIEVRADTPADVFAEAMAAVEAFEPEARAGYRPVGVRANGVTVCFDDPQREVLLSLREWLRETGQSLQGQWACGSPSLERPPGYRGTLAAFVADTERIRPLLEREPARRLTLAGELSRPNGSLAGSWAEVPPTLGPTMALLEDRHDVVRMQLDGSVLQVAVDPVQDLSQTEAAVAEVAGDLDVRLYQGAIDDAGQEAYASFGPLADSVRAQEGVTRVQVRANHLQVRVQDVSAVRAVHDLVFGADRPEGTHLEIVVPSPEGRVGDESTYKRNATSQGGHVDLFIALVEEREVARVSLIEESQVQQQWLQLKVRTSLEQTLPLLRGVLPEGMRVTLFGGGPDQSATVVIRDRMTADDFSATRLDVSARQRLAELWNAAG